MWYADKMYELGEVLALLHPRRSARVKRIGIVVECKLPLDVETAIGLQIVGQQAVSDPNLELTILVSLEEE